jgi:hypothetical protein
MVNGTGEIIDTSGPSWGTASYNVAKGYAKIARRARARKPSAPRRKLSKGGLHPLLGITSS